jgi:DNA-binding Lrp family transcriptional regulator
MKMLAVKKQIKGNMIIKRTDKQKGNFTQIDNNIITNTLLSAGARIVLIYILSLKEDSIKLNQSQIANKTGLSERSITNYIKELKKYGYVKIEEINYKGNYYSNYIINEETTILPANFASEPSAKFASKPSAKFAGTKKNKNQVETIINKSFEDKKEDLEAVRKFCVHNNTNIYNTNNNTKKVFEREDTQTLDFELEKEKKEVRKQLIDLGVKAVEKLINTSLENCKKRISYISKGASDNPYEIYQDILNGSPVPEIVTKYNYFQKQREFNLFFNPIAKIWRTDITKPEKDRKIDFITKILRDFQRLYNTKGDIEIREKRFELQEKLKETVNKLGFKELIEMIDTVYFKKEYSLSISDKSNFEALSETNFTLSSLEKEISKMIGVV